MPGQVAKGLTPADPPLNKPGISGYYSAPTGVPQKTMRIRTMERPPAKEDIDRILQKGASAEDRQVLGQFLRRLKQSWFLDEKSQPLSPRERAVRQYKNDGFVLFIGAGVSACSGLPSWPTLADMILEKSGVAREGLDDLKRALPTYIAQFELAGHRLGSQAFVRALYDALYGKMECKPLLEKIPLTYEDQIGWSGWGEILEALKANKTLEAVGDLLIVEGPKAPRRNPQVHAVLTFNADTLLELYCQAKTGGRHAVIMVDRASVGDHPDQTPIYHLHGTLDVRGENFLRCAPPSVPKNELQELVDELLPDLVFRESEYYETIANPVSFVNHTPQSFLRRLNALFIGTSLDDLNMRRWLHDSFRERVRHRTKYLRELYWRRYEAAEREATLQSVRHFWLRSETEKVSGRDWVVPKIHVEKVVESLGIQVIWCEDYSDMQGFIRELRSLGYDESFGRKAAPHPS